MHTYKIKEGIHKAHLAIPSPKLQKCKPQPGIKHQVWILILEELFMKEGNDEGARSESCQRLCGIVNEVNINRGTELKTANAKGKEKEREPKKLQGKLNLAMKKICGGKLKVEV